VLALGARGYLSKRIAPEEMVAAVRAVAAGDRYVDASLAKLLELPEGAGAQDPVHLLSAREFDVFIQLARGASVNRIAETLHLSPSTVGTHLYNIKQKLGVANQAELTLIAVRHGLIET
jgi:two-component system invasion response regulator UvrY